MAEDNKGSKVSFADLDIVLKIAPIIGLAVLTYLQTLFPSKDEFDKLNQHLIQMDKKMTEMNILHNKTVITDDIKQINQRIRALELEVAKHNAADGVPSSFNWSPNYLPRNNSTERNSNSNRSTQKERRERAAKEKKEKTAANKKKNTPNKNNKNSSKNLLENIVPRKPKSN